MTVTYDLDTNIGKVRLMIGDKDIADSVFSDEELQIFLDIESDNLNRSAADALEAWAATYGANADSEKIGDYAFTQKVVDKMLSLAKRLRATDAATPYLTWSEWDLSGGSGITAEED